MRADGTAACACYHERTGGPHSFAADLCCGRLGARTLRAPKMAPRRHGLAGFGLSVWRLINRNSMVPTPTRGGDVCKGVAPE